MNRSLVLFFLFKFISQLNAAKILAVISTPSISHQVIFRPLTQELARRGHDVTVITTDPVFTKGNAPARLNEIDVHDISYKLWKDTMVKEKMVFGAKENIYQQVDVIGRMLKDVAEIQMKTKDVQSILKQKNNTYDLLIIEECSKPYMILSHIFKAPVILISSFGILLGDESVVGVPDHPFLYPTMVQQKFFNLTFWDKLDEIYKRYWNLHLWFSEQRKQDQVLKKLFGDDVPTISDLSVNVDMLFVNVHPTWNNNRPLPPNVISIWGIHKNPEKDLPKDLQTYLDSSKNGVIYISFGTNVPSSLLPSDKIQLFKNVFSKLPYDVLWKWEQNEMVGKSENVKISKWLPQSDLLRHPNIKLFITQGGLQSTDEAITAGVPVIGIPMLGDQWYNAEYYSFHKIGVQLDFQSLTEDVLYEAVTTVINDTSYRNNIIRLRTLVNDQPESALDRAVWWTEYVLRHGGAKHLRTPAANMPWTTYYEVEFIATLAVIALVILIVPIYILYSLQRLITSKTKSKLS